MVRAHCSWKKGIEKPIDLKGPPNGCQDNVSLEPDLGALSAFRPAMRDALSEKKEGELEAGVGRSGGVLWASEAVLQASATPAKKLQASASDLI
jgi:hypothetical protein